jgi:uncharacterized protein YqjF (DUF2071 family)
MFLISWICSPAHISRSIVTILDRLASMRPGIPIMKQTWSNLVFANWQVDESILRPHVPRIFELDRFEGKHWLTVTPLLMSNVGLNALPSEFAFSPFLELNLRTYVLFNDKPGVLFLSLDTQNFIAAKVARWWYGLPYFPAKMSMNQLERTYHFSSLRSHPQYSEVRFECEYTPTGESFNADRNSLSHWLVERYCLYTMGSSNRAHIAEIRHKPWTLQSADVKIYHNSLTNFMNLDLSIQKPLCFFSKQMDVEVWSPKRLPATR